MLVAGAGEARVRRVRLSGPNRLAVGFECRVLARAPDARALIPRQPAKSLLAWPMSGSRKSFSAAALAPRVAPRASPRASRAAGTWRRQARQRA